VQYYFNYNLFIMRRLIYFILLTYGLSWHTNLSAQTVIFQDDFEAGTVFGSAWTATSVGTNGLVQIGTAFQGADASANGNNGVAMGKTSDAGGFNLNRLDLSLNLSGRTQVELSFWLREYFDETHPEDGIFLSDDGVNFTKVMNFEGANWADAIWSKLPPLDIDRLAVHYGLTLSSTFVIRFQQYDDGDFSFTNDEDGYFLDDVLVTVPNQTYISTFPYTEGFENGTLFPAGWKHANPTFPYINPVAANSTGLVNGLPTVRLEGVVGIGNSFQNITDMSKTGQNGLYIGKRTDGILGTSAVDLHLNLSATPQIELSFWLSDIADDTHPLDGIYFSNDAGLTFIKVMDFDGTNWANTNYSKLPPLDIDRLAAHYGLTLSSTFVIRFQQYDDGDFDFTNDEDGFVIDDVEVRVPDQTYISTFPYTEGFENGTLFPAGWKHANPTFPYINPIVANSTGLINGLSTVRLEGVVGIGNSFQSITDMSRTGQNGLYIGKRTDGILGTSAVDLHLNLSATPQIELSFWLSDIADDTHPLDGIYFSNDAGLTFIKVMDFDGTNWANTNYSKLPPLDIDRLAAHYGLTLSSTFVIRFQQYDDGDFDFTNDEDGFVIDDVEVRVPDQTYISTFPYTEGFENGTLLPAGWKHANPTFPYINPIVANSTGLVNGLSTVRLEGAVGITGTFQSVDASRNGTNGLYIGKRADGVLGTSALDLHLNLTSQSTVNLKFWLKSFFEEAHPIDGIYFSNDGGLTFKKVVDFNFTTQNTWLEQSVDVDALASTANLAFSDKFVIRIQQYDDADFDFTNDEDGFTIDDIQITTLSAPQNLTATTISATQINLNWDDVAGATGYKVQRRAGQAGNFTDVTTVNTSEFQNTTGLSSATEYCYRVIAVANTLESQPSTVVCATTLPTKPAGLSVTLASPTQLNLTWTAVTGASSYKIQRSTTGANGNFSQIATANTNSFSNTGLTTGQEYCYKIIAVGVGGDSEASNATCNTPQKLDQTITFNALPNRTFGDTHPALSATSSSGLAVSFSVPANNGVVKLSGINNSDVEIIGAGQVNITASQAGNTTYNAATNVVRQLVVNKANQTITFDVLSNRVYNESFPLTATASSGLPVSFTVPNGNGIVNLIGNNNSQAQVTGVGQVVITASQAGNENYNPAIVVNRTLTTIKANQTITFNALSNRAYDESFALAATASSGLPVSFSVPNGNGIVNLTGNNNSEAIVTGVGQVMITASQAGNDNYNAATAVNRTLTTVKANQTITFNALPNKTFGDIDFSVSATASSQLAVTFEGDNPSVATVSSTGSVEIKKAGTVNITAKQVGNANYNSATNVIRSLTINKANQTITFDALPSKTFGDANFSISATTNSQLAVIFEGDNDAVATVSSAGLVTIIKAGTVNITAKQVGNENYNPATNVTRSLTINKANQTITFNALANKACGDAAFNLNASSNSNLVVSFEGDNPSVATVSSAGLVTIIKAGTVNITAKQAGNDNYNVATNVSRALTITKGVANINFAPISDQAFMQDKTFNLNATSAQGTVSFSLVNTANTIATLTANTLTFKGLGLVTVRASVSNDCYEGVLERSFNISFPTALEDDILAKVTQISPNPTSDFIEIKIDLPNLQNVDLELINAWGISRNREILNGDGNRLHARLDVRDYPAGVYFVKIAYKEYKLIKRIVKY
jgi:hypothetical protein